MAAVLSYQEQRNQDSLMPPPPASSAASRLFLRPALRTQSDRRLVSLVRNGYENAFEEIVRRYGKALGGYAAAIVPSHRAEDVTQDAFSKALLALRDTDKEIELRPWLYRIVRNTALNDLRDQPPVAAPLHENLDGVETPADAAERREEIAELLDRLRALPEPQRAAIVMRELEGLSHEEIAAALGLTGGAARQTIYRARRALRNGFGVLIPIPLLHLLLAGGGAGAAAGSAGAAGAAGAASGGAGAGIGLKAGIASVVVAGSVATGVAVKETTDDRAGGRTADSTARTAGGGPSETPALAAQPFDDGSGSGRGEGERGDGGRDDDHRGRGRGGDGDDDRDGDGHGPSASSGPGSGDRDDDDDDDGSGHGGSGSGSGGGGHSGSGSGGSGSGGSGSGGSGSSGSGSSGPGSGDAEEELDDDSSGPGSGDDDFELDD